MHEIVQHDQKPTYCENKLYLISSLSELLYKTYHSYVKIDHYETNRAWPVGDFLSADKSSRDSICNFSRKYFFAFFNYESFLAYETIQIRVNLFRCWQLKFLLDFKTSHNDGDNILDISYKLLSAPDQLPEQSFLKLQEIRNFSQ